jgi:hypothetical protein
MVNGRREEAHIESRQTLLMKTVSHMPLSAFLLFQPLLRMLPEEIPYVSLPSSLTTFTSPSPSPSLFLSNSVGKHFERRQPISCPDY